MHTYDGLVRMYIRMGYLEDLRDIFKNASKSFVICVIIILTRTCLNCFDSKLLSLFKQALVNSISSNSS